MIDERDEVLLGLYGDDPEPDPIAPPVIPNFVPSDTLAESNLKAAAAWLNNKTDDAQLASIDKYVRDARKKQEVFAIQRANSTAIRYADLFETLHQRLLPQALQPLRIQGLGSKDLHYLIDLVHKIMKDDGAYLTEFLKSGPQEVPPLVQNQVSLANAGSGDRIQQISQRLSSADPKSREKMRLLVDKLDALAQSVFVQKTEPEAQEKP